MLSLFCCVAVGPSGLLCDLSRSLLGKSKLNILVLPARGVSKNGPQKNGKTLVAVRLDAGGQDDDADL